MARMSSRWRARTTCLIRRASPDLPLPLSPYTTVMPLGANVRTCPAAKALTLIRSRMPRRHNCWPVDSGAPRVEPSQPSFGAAGGSLRRLARVRGSQPGRATHRQPDAPALAAATKGQVTAQSRISSSSPTPWPSCHHRAHSIGRPCLHVALAHGLGEDSRTVLGREDAARPSDARTTRVHHRPHLSAEAVGKVIRGQGAVKSVRGLIAISGDQDPDLHLRW